MSERSAPPTARGERATVRVRPARPEDAGEIWRLIGGLARYERMESFYTGSAERLHAHLFGDGWPRIEALVAEQDGVAIGYAIYYGVFSTFWTVPMLWLEDLYVEETRRGTGAGRALLAAIARVAVERGCVRVDWAVLDWNEPAIGFYEAMGATRHGGWPTYRLTGERLSAIAAESRTD